MVKASFKLWILRNAFVYDSCVRLEEHAWQGRSMRDFYSSDMKLLLNLLGTSEGGSISGGIVAWNI